MKNIRFFFPENFQFLEMKFSIYFNRPVFVMRLYLTSFITEFLKRTLQSFYLVLSIVVNRGFTQNH